jgi:hypothetical protein
MKVIYRLTAGVAVSPPAVRHCTATALLQKEV